MRSSDEEGDYTEINDGDEHTLIEAGSGLTKNIMIINTGAAGKWWVAGRNKRPLPAGPTSITLPLSLNGAAIMVQGNGLVVWAEVY